MPRGRGKNYKGRSRHFTSAEEIDRQMNDDTWRRTDKKDEAGDDDEENSSSDDEQQNGSTTKGVIDIENPNRVVNKLKKAGDIEADAPKVELSRREREAIEKEQAKARYDKLHAEGKTDEARADLARLSIIKKQREEAAKKKEQDKQDKDAKVKAADDARKAAMEAQMSAPKPGGRRKKR